MLCQKFRVSNVTNNILSIGRFSVSDIGQPKYTWFSPGVKILFKIWYADKYNVHTNHRMSHFNQKHVAALLHHNMLYNNILTIVWPILNPPPPPQKKKGIAL